MCQTEFVKSRLVWFSEEFTWQRGGKVWLLVAFLATPCLQHLVCFWLRLPWICAHIWGSTRLWRACLCQRAEHWCVPCDRPHRTGLWGLSWRNHTEGEQGGWISLSRDTHIVYPPYSWFCSVLIYQHATQCQKLSGKVTKNTINLNNVSWTFYFLFQLT